MGTIFKITESVQVEQRDPLRASDVVQELMRQLFGYVVEGDFVIRRY